ncbi:MAG: hypothetical protein JOZ69_05390 [Myxococcales bacterium]|nr:hypothetical protein [Myxococcales bacterium]
MNLAERRQIQIDTVAAFRPHVAALARELVPEPYRDDGEQVACVGVLIALARHAGPGPLALETALEGARAEIALWLSAGTVWVRDGAPDVDEATAHARLREFASTLTADELALLFSDDPRRVRSRRYLSLVARAQGFVKAKPSA